MNIEYKDGVATITAGARQTTINVGVVAQSAIDQQLDRVSMKDVQALAAGYLALRNQITLLEARADHPASPPPPARTDAEIIGQTDELAAALAECDGYLLVGGLYHKDSSPRSQAYWKKACVVMELLTNTDPNNAVANLEES